MSWRLASRLIISRLSQSRTLLQPTRCMADDHVDRSIPPEKRNPKKEPQWGEMTMWGEHRPKADYETVAQRVTNCVLAQGKILDAQAKNRNGHFINDFGLDSLDHVEILMLLEDEFWIDLDTKMTDQLYSIHSITQYFVDLHNNTDDLRKRPPLWYVPGLLRPPKIVEDPPKFPGHDADDADTIY